MSVAVPAWSPPRGGEEIEPGVWLDAAGGVCVDPALVAGWERDREARNRRHDGWARHERARPVKPSIEDLEAQLHALRWHNAALVERLDDVVLWVLELLARRG